MGLGGVAPVVLKNEIVSLCPEGLHGVDVDAFEAMAAVARRRATAAGSPQMLELYGGELLPDDLYEDWGADRREGLRRLKVDLLLGSAVATVGDRLAVIEIYRQALAAYLYNGSPAVLGRDGCSGRGR